MTFYYQQFLAIRAAVYPESEAYLLARLRRAQAFMQAHYAEPLTLEEVAAAACFSPSHFRRLFRRYYGRAPQQYLREVRVGRARELLRAGWPVATTCAAVGFESPSSFTALFRRATGYAPADFGRLAGGEKSF